ncbi:HMCN [Mytilus coruscus]|uniref:HMCN n=1 Tax=Mytilus coruscus TaxID=42192 RepID=A0A6J8B3U5_MYTCO|nr:HMCN [Mytilus coruscus]
MTCLGTSKQYVLRTLVLLSLATLSFCQSAGYTVITGPTFKVEGDSVLLTCNSTYGTPVDWFLNNQLLDDSWTTANGVTTNTYTFLANKTHHLAMFECRVDNVLSATWYFQVYTKPNPPTLDGPHILILGTTYHWTCISTGGIPSPSMTMWIGDSQFNYNISSINTDIKSELQSSDKTYTVNFTLSWAPSISYNGLTLYCHVQHPETSGNSRQTDSLLLTVNAEPNHPTLTGSQILILGTTYQWTCISTGGIPSPLMTMWIGNSQINTGITQSSILQSDGTYIVTSTLSWAPNIRDNGQTLYCHVQHPATRVNKTVSLQLTVNEPLSVNATPTQYQQNIGTIVTLNCVITGTATSITWYFNNQVIDIASSSKHSNGNTINPSLTISNIALSDTGLYNCQATNGVETANSNTITLTVLDLLTVTIPQSSYSVLTDVTGGVPIVIVGGSNFQVQSISTSLTVVGNIPTVTVQQTIYNVNYGNSAVLVCSVTANPVHTIVYWRKIKNGVTTDINVETSNNKYSGSTVSNPSLQINNVDLNDEAYYVCFASNSVGTGQSSQTFLDVIGDISVNSVGTGSSQQTYLDVIGDIPSVQVLSNTYSVNFGGTIVLGCQVTANPLATDVYWQKLVNGVLITVDMSTNNFNKYSGSTVQSPSLIIIDATEADEGNYVCTATNAAGTGSSSQTFLNVVGHIPTVSIPQSSYSVNVGSQITIPCTVSANPSETNIYWTVTVGNNAEQTVSMTNAQKYQGSSSQQTYVDVIGSLPVVTVQSNSYSVLLGQTATLVCTISANPSATSVLWYKIINGVQSSLSTIAGKYNTPTVSSSNLIINNAAQSDSGYYVCTATNVVGTGSSSQIYLTVTGNLPSVTVALSNYNTNIDVIGSIPTVTIGSNYYSVNYGNTASIVCNVVATPTETSISWQKIQNGIPSTIVISGRYQGGTVSSPNLIITGAESTDEAFYICSASNSLGTGQSSQTYLDVQGSVPSVQILSNYYSVEIGLSITLQCTVTGNPSHTSVTWNKIVNGQQTNIGSNIRYSGGSTNTPSLTISNAIDTDEGYYICTAANAVGTGQSSQTYLDVTGSILTVTVPQSSYSVNYGQSVQLGDEGYYTCQATNSVGTGTSTQTFLNVQGTIPVVTIPQSQYSVNVGSSVTMVCTISANPVHTSVFWHKVVNGVATNVNLSQTSKYSGSTTTSPSLTVLNAVIADEGYYTCSAQNSVGIGTSSQTFLDVSGSTIDVDLFDHDITNVGPFYPDITIACLFDPNTTNVVLLVLIKPIVGTGTSNNVYLTVTGDAPTSIAIRPSPITVNEGQTITATCTAQGSPILTYTWFKGNSNIQLSTGSVLQITSSTRTDAGTYQCRASNTYGNADATVTVEVQYIPDVTISQPSQGFLGQAITIQCSYVSNPGATNVIWSKGNQGITVDGNKYVGGSLSNPSLTITNLAASDQGSYRCSVVNSVGQGDSSSVTILVDTSTAPSYIRIVPACLVVNEGESFTLTCEADGDPAPTFNWYQHDVLIHQGAVLSISNANWTIHDGLNVCKATNTKGSRQTWESVVVQHKPVSTVTQTRISQIVGSPVILSCDTRANPSATEWQWFYNGYSLSSTSKVLVVDMDSASDAGSYTCRAMNGVGTSSDIAFNIAILTGTVTDPAGPATGASITDTAMLSTGEIVAILLAILFVLLLIIGIIVCCCCQEKCASLCGGKKERITPQEPPKKVEIPVYYREPDESVISLRKLEIPTFKQDAEQPVKHNVYSELPVRMARPETHNVYSRHPEDEDEENEINKYQGFQPEDNEKLEQRERSIDNPYSDITCTYEEEERRRKRRRRKKKKNKRLRDEFTVEDGIENGDALRSKVRSRRRKHGTLRTSRDHEHDVMIGEKFYYEQE